MTTKLYAVGATAVTVRDCDDGYQVTTNELGVIERAIDGTAIRHVVANKQVWDVVWSHLSSAEEAILWAEIMRTGQLTLILPNAGTSFTVYSTNPTRTVTQFGVTVRGHFEQV